MTIKNQLIPLVVLPLSTSDLNKTHTIIASISCVWYTQKNLSYSYAFVFKSTVLPSLYWACTCITLYHLASSIASAIYLGN